jgi:Putative zinc ribbon domain
MTPLTTICQSCAMPMKTKIHPHGTNADGTCSECYCIECFQDGAFIQPDITLDAMRMFVRIKLKTVGAGVMAGWFIQQLPHLERWRMATA